MGVSAQLELMKKSLTDVLASGVMTVMSTLDNKQQQQQQQVYFKLNIAYKACARN